MIDLRRCYKDAAENHIFGETELLPHIELALVFGSKYIIPELAHAAAQGYHHGRFRKIMTLGGVTTDDNGKTESDAIADRLIYELGVPARAILRETESQNTLENAVNALKMMKDHLGDEPPYSIIGYGHARAGMRFLWTMNKVFTSSVLMFKQVFPNGFNQQNALLNDAFRQACHEQHQRLDFYSHSRYVSPTTLADINDRVYDALPRCEAA